jgi:hypothetical protein
MEFSNVNLSGWIAASYPPQRPFGDDVKARLQAIVWAFLNKIRARPPINQIKTMKLATIANSLVS